MDISCAKRWLFLAFNATICFFLGRFPLLVSHLNCERVGQYKCLGIWEAIIYAVICVCFLSKVCHSSTFRMRVVSMCI